MLELHIWGTSTEFSPISPESLALVWFLKLYLQPCEYTVIASSNTNLSPTGVLPVLIDTISNDKVDSFQLIVEYVTSNFKSSSTCPIQFGDSHSSIHTINNLGLISLVQTKISVLTKYVLYLNSSNYTKFTRKLFPQYLPFPMMYNQPTIYYNIAKSQCEKVSLAPTKDFFGNDTDLVKEEDEPVLSSLHGAKLLEKKKNVSALKESKYSIRCMNLLSIYLKEILQFGDSKSDFLFAQEKVFSGELLLYAHLHSMTTGLPDKFIDTFLSNEFKSLHTHMKSIIDGFNSIETSTRNVKSYEKPSLLNEINYKIGLIKY